MIAVFDGNKRYTTKIRDVFNGFYQFAIGATFFMEFSVELAISNEISIRLATFDRFFDGSTSFSNHRIFDLFLRILSKISLKNLVDN